MSNVTLPTLVPPGGWSSPVPPAAVKAVALWWVLAFGLVSVGAIVYLRRRKAQRKARR